MLLERSTVTMIFSEEFRREVRSHFMREQFHPREYQILFAAYRKHQHKLPLKIYFPEILSLIKLLFDILRTCSNSILSCHRRVFHLFGTVIRWFVNYNGIAAVITRVTSHKSVTGSFNQSISPSEVNISCLSYQSKYTAKGFISKPQCVYKEELSV